MISTEAINIDLTSLSIIYENDQIEDNPQPNIITWNNNDINDNVNDSQIHKCAHQNATNKASTSLVSQSMEQSLQMKWKSIIIPNENPNSSTFNEFHCFYWKVEVR